MVKKSGKENSEGNLGTAETAVSSRKSVLLGGRNRSGSVQRTNKDFKTEDGSNRIVCLMNYFRLLYLIRQRVIVTLSAAEEEEVTRLEKVQAAIERELVGVFGMHLEAASTGKNVFKMEESFWGQLKEGKQWKRYCFVIDQYNSKYS